LPFVLLGLFAVLVVGAIVLSLASAAPLAQQQLQDAAHATMAAPSFSLTVTSSVTNPTPSSAGGQPVGTVQLLVLYRAPDAVEETERGLPGQSASVIVIGDRRYRATDGHWTALPPSAGVGALVVKSLMTPLQAATKASDVTGRGDVYRFGTNDLPQVVRSLLAVGTTPLSAPRLTAVVRGGYLTQERITALVSDQRLDLDLEFSAIGSAPPVRVPSSLGPALSPPGASSAP
jgi:hypothetical protein